MLSFPTILAPGPGRAREVSEERYVRGNPYVRSELYVRGKRYV
ncbi:hypothetical protein ACFV9P_17100 [Streptomyces sp. NPDC059892]